MLLVLLGVYAWTDACAAVAAEGLALRFIALFTHPISPLLPHPNPRPALQYTLRRRRCPAAPSPSWRCSPLSWRPSCWCLAPSTSYTLGVHGWAGVVFIFVVGQGCSARPLSCALILPYPAAYAWLVCSWHMFDAVIVLVSFTLELSLRGVAQEVASLLIFFR